RAIIMSKYNSLVVGLSLAIAYGGCSGRAKLGGDSETHFLQSCEESCPGDLSCVCGLCTKACDQDSECKPFHGSATCSRAAAPSGDTVERLCDLQCTSDEDCSSLGPEHRCEEGACRPIASVGIGGNAGNGSGGTSGSGGGNASSTNGGSAGATGECCLDAEIRWSYYSFFGPAQPWYSLSGCGVFRNDSTRDASDCESELPACPAELEVDADVVNQALADADVQAALAQAPITFGFDRRQVDGAAFDVEIDGLVITIGDDCANDDCLPIPPGIRSLRQLLDRVKLPQIALSGSCEQEPLCSEPAEPGPCEAAIVRWFFNADTHRCEQFTYGGCEGNANNFESSSECKLACDNDPCSYGTPYPGELTECSVVADGQCFETAEQACECACFAHGGSLDQCIIDEPVPPVASCVPPG